MHKQMNLTLRKSCLAATPGIYLIIYIMLQQQWDDDLIYGADKVYNDTDKQLLVLIAMTAKGVLNLR